MGCVKFVLPLLVAAVCALAACETTADRRDLYAPNKPEGPYTDKLREMTLAWRLDHQSSTFTYAVAGNGSQPPDESGPIAPPPPPPPPSATPDTESGAPAATPMPESALPGGNAPAAVPGLSAPAATPSAAGLPAPAPAPAATPAPAGGANSAPVIPGLSQ
jgi:hypothetical protein